jgi:hypothetical protein
MTNRIEVKAKQAFYSDLTGARANGEIFQLTKTLLTNFKKLVMFKNLTFRLRGRN